MDAVILAGGLGTRLKGVISNIPKPLAPINGRPFLDILFKQISTFALIDRVILATGYLAGHISSYYEGKSYPFSLLFSEETTPLGTGGALKQAMTQVLSETFFVLNGDSFFDINFHLMNEMHQKKKAQFTIACAYVEDISRYGEVKLDEIGKVISFNEKSSTQKAGWINGGIYLINQKVILSEKIEFSLEKEVVPRLVDQALFGFQSKGKFIDIGTAQSYNLAQEILL